MLSSFFQNQITNCITGSLLSLQMLHSRSSHLSIIRMRPKLLEEDGCPTHILFSSHIFFQEAALKQQMWTPELSGKRCASIPPLCLARSPETLSPGTPRHCALLRAPPSGLSGTPAAHEQNSHCHPFDYSGRDLLPFQDVNYQLSSGHKGTQLHIRKKHHRNVNQF